MKILGLLPLSLLACGCEQVYVDPMVKDYINEFEAICESYGYSCEDQNIGVFIDDHIEIEGIPPNLLVSGFCSHEQGYMSVKKEIHIRRTDANGMPWAEWDLKATVFHEAFHCYLDREHDDNQTSIMAPLAAPSSYYKQHLEEMIHDEFEKGIVVKHP